MDLKPSAPSVPAKSALSSPGCYHCYTFMGSHPATENGREGWRFRVWAPAAQGVSVIGDFNGWQPESHPMAREPGGCGRCSSPAWPNMTATNTPSAPRRGRC